MSTYATNTTSAPLFSGLNAFVSNMIEAASQYSQYRKTIRELGTLSSRELHDLGLNRSAIKSIAREAVYGA